ncbi:hypothetical protein LX64_00999 [Chitinophaga skermanii]|uniref:Ricin-type beta-trefoil lectin protein n=1 Tax=Chitinophaga skermanii TaxID=331697 RepID=A0A327QVJ5_9BACT|nr:hypothetical protein [Chitinophaga skermanii]RAJ08351.1 hypothetical protein LX64_00999 [Chitinophaga skermanii]
MSITTAPAISPIATYLSSTPLTREDQSFYIQTALSGAILGDGNPMVMNYSNNAITIEQWQPGNQAQLWVFNNKGAISPITDPTMGITTSATSSQSAEGLSIETFTGASNQVWSFSNNQFIVDLGGSTGQLCLNVQGGGSAAGTSVITYAISKSTNEYWHPFPAQVIPANTWFYLQTNLQNSSGNTGIYVMTAMAESNGNNPLVAIQPYKEGAADQQWMMTPSGTVVNALYPNLALTSNSSDDEPISLQAIQSNYTNQQWCYVEGMLACGSAGNTWYLNVQDAILAPGQPLINYDFSKGTDNEGWTVIPYVPSGQWFTIQSAMEPFGNTAGLLTLAPSGTINLQLAVNAQEVPAGPGALAQLWRRTTDGNIVSATNPNLALAATTTNGNLTIAPLQKENPLQQWTWSNLQAESESKTNEVLCGMLENFSLKQVINGTSKLGQPLALSDAITTPGSGQVPQLFYVVPYGIPMSQSTTIQMAQEDLYLTLPPYVNPGTYVQITQLTSEPALSTWEYQHPGYIVSSAYPNMVLTATPDNSNYVFILGVYPRQPEPEAFQLWWISEEGCIVNRATGLVISNLGTPANTAVLLQRLSPLPGYQSWTCSTGTSLEIAIMQPSSAYPNYPQTDANGNTTAYGDICSKLGLPNGIREQYINLASPVDNYQSIMNIYYTSLLVNSNPLPPSLTLEDYAPVVKQLNEEMLAVSGVRRLFQQMTTLYLSLSQAQEMLLSELITGCALPNGLKTIVPPPPQKKKSWIGDLVEGLAYTALNIAGSVEGDPFLGKQVAAAAKFGLPVVANLMSTGFSVYQGAQQTTSYLSKYAAILNKAELNIYTYEMTVLELQQVLLNEFESLGSALGQLETFILANWGITEHVFNMSKAMGSRQSLFWPATLTGTDTRNMLAEYTISVLQTLMPANPGFTINANLHTNATSPVSPAGWQSDGSFVENNDDGTQNVYTNTVNKEIMDIIWGLGTVPLSFYKGLNGWALKTSYQGLLVQNSDTPPDGASIVVSIINYTGSTIYADLLLCCLLNSTANNNPTLCTSITYTISPYGTQQFAGGYFAHFSQIGGANFNMPYGLQSNDSGDNGITLSDDSSTVMGTQVYNSFQSSGNNRENLINTLPTYTFPGLTFYAPYFGTLKQTTNSQGVVFVTIEVYKE